MSTFFSRKILLGAVVLLLLIALPVSIYLVRQQQIIRSKASGSVTMVFTPSSGDKQNGSSFGVDVSLDAGTNHVSTSEIKFTYNKSKLRVVDFIPAANFTTQIKELGTDSGATDKQFYFSGTVPSSVSVTGANVPVGRITFEALNIGTVSLAFADTRITVLEQDVYIPATIGTVSFNIVTGGTVTPTPGSASVSFSPSSATKSKNTQFDVDLVLNNPSAFDISSAKISVSVVDNSILKMVSFTPIGPLVEYSKTTINDSGNFTYIATTPTLVSGRDTRITIGRFKFETKGLVGSSQVRFGTVEVTASGQDQFLSISGNIEGSYEVVVSTPTPISTPGPTVSCSGFGLSGKTPSGTGAGGIPIYTFPAEGGRNLLSLTRSPTTATINQPIVSAKHPGTATDLAFESAVDGSGNWFVNTPANTGSVVNEYNLSTSISVSGQNAACTPTIITIRVEKPVVPVTPTPTATPIPAKNTRCFAFGEGSSVRTAIENLNTTDAANFCKTVAEGGRVDNVLIFPYSTNPDTTIFKNYTFKDLTPGIKTFFVKFFGLEGTVTKVTPILTKSITFNPNPLITNLDCTHSASGSQTLFTITGANFGTQGRASKVKVAGKDVDIDSWDQLTNTVMAHVDTRLEGKIPVDLIVNDGRTDKLECTVNTSTVVFKAALQCKAAGNFAASDVDLSVYEAVLASTNSVNPEPIVQQKISLDKDGNPLGFAPKFEKNNLKNKRYQLIIKAPGTLARRVDFDTKGAGSVRLNSGKAIILPQGDIAPANAPDGKINAFDKSEMTKQWNILTDVVRTADLNGDNRVNSIDWACMRANFNDVDQIFSPISAVVSPSSTPALGVGGTAPTSTSTPTPTTAPISSCTVTTPVITATPGCDGNNPYVNLTFSGATVSNGDTITSYTIWRDDLTDTFGAIVSSTTPTYRDTNGGGAVGGIVRPSTTYTYHVTANASRCSSTRPSVSVTTSACSGGTI